MTKTLQPYIKFESVLIQKLAYQGYKYLVSQSYARAMDEMDHTKIPILFTAYKELKDASAHYNYLIKKQRKDSLAAIVDMLKTSITAKIVNICNGNTNKVAYLSMVGNSEYVNRYIDRHYYEKMRSWVRKNRETWNIQQHNSLQPVFETVMGEPMVKIKWGTHSVMVTLEELERM